MEIFDARITGYAEVIDISDFKHHRGCRIASIDLETKFAVPEHEGRSRCRIQHDEENRQTLRHPVHL